MAEPTPWVHQAPCAYVWMVSGAAFQTTRVTPEVIQPARVVCRAEQLAETGVVVESPVAALVLAQPTPLKTLVEFPTMLTVFNTVTMGAVEYSLNWSDVATVSGVLYGLSAEGIEYLSGVTAAVPQVTTGQLQLAGGQEFNMPRLTLGASGESCSVEVSAKTQGVVQVLNMADVELTGELDQHEVMVGAGQHARAYEVTLKGAERVQSLDGWFNTVRHRRA